MSKTYKFQKLVFETIWKYYKVQNDFSFKTHKQLARLKYLAKPEAHGPHRFPEQQ